MDVSLATEALRWNSPDLKRTQFTKYPYYLSSVWKLMIGMKPRLQVIRAFARRAAPGPHLIELRGGVRLKTRGAMDIWTAKETFLDRFYEKFGFPIDDGWTVVDVGGGIGDYTIFAALRSPHGKVYAFEPTPESFTLLQENVNLNRIGNVEAFAEAVWSENGTLTIDTAAPEPGQYATHRGGGSATVPSVPLAEVFQRSGHRRWDLLKLDCEGAEFAILFNTPPELLRCINRIVLEYHDGVTAHSHRELAHFLTEHGFAVETFPNYVHTNLGYLRAIRRGLVSRTYRRQDVNAKAP